MNNSYLITLKKLFKKNKNIIKITICIVFLIWVHFCLLHSDTPPHTNKTKNSTDTIKLGTVKSIPPFVFTTEKDGQFSSNSEEQISGIDILLFQAIVNQLRKKLELKVYELPGLINALKQGDVDAIIGSLDETENRKTYFDSIPYAKNDLGILFKKNNTNFLHFSNKNEIELKNFNKSNNDQIKWLTVQGSNYDIEKEDIIKQLNSQMTKKTTCFENMEQCIFEVEKGTADCVLFDYPMLQNFAKRIVNQNLFQVLKLTDPDLSLKPLNIFVKKDSPLKHVIKKTLKNLDIDDQKLLTINENNYFYQQAQTALQRNEQRNQRILKKNIWQKIFYQLSNYKKSLFITLLLAIDSLFLGFSLSIVFFRVSIFTNEHSKIVFYFKRNLTKIISIFNYLFKAIPLAIIILFLYNGFTFCGIRFFSEGVKGPFYLSLLVCSLNTSFILNNNMMNNYKFLDKGQIEAAYVLGMDSKQVFNEIIFNQILKRIIPSLRNQFIFNIKDTAFFSIIGLNNLLWVANRNISATYDCITPLIIISFIYLLLIFLSEILTKINFSHIFSFFHNQAKKISFEICCAKKFKNKKKNRKR